MADPTPQSPVGAAYVHRRLSEIYGFPVHRTTTETMLKKKGFPLPMYAHDDRIFLGHKERLYRRDRVDAFIDRCALEIRPRRAGSIT